MNLRNMGSVVGLIVGIIVSVFVVRAMNKDGKYKTKYDEMQKIARGHAYRYAYWTLVGYEALFLILEGMGVPKFFDSYTTQFIGLIISVMVQASYCIWNNAYIGLNTNPKRFAIISIWIGIMNFVIGLSWLIRSGFLVNGVVHESAINLAVAICFVIMGIELFIKWNMDRKESESEEE